jgi:hypothetical protein
LNASFKRFNPLTVLFPPLLVVHQCFDVFQPFHISGGKNQQQANNQPRNKNNGNNSSKKKQKS